MKDITYHSKYLCFRFTRNSMGKSELHYKRFSTDKAWGPVDDEGVQLNKGLELTWVCTVYIRNYLGHYFFLVST